MIQKINFLMFCALSGMVVLTALWAIFARKIVHSVLGAAVCFLLIAGVFFTLNADFVGISQILIYGVGVSILLAFAIMFTSKDQENQLYVANPARLFFGFVAVAALFLSIGFFLVPDLLGKDIFLIKAPTPQQAMVLHERGTSKIIGRRIFCDCVLPFELLSLLLLAGLVGAGYLASKEKEGEKESV